MHRHIGLVLIGTLSLLPLAAATSGAVSPEKRVPSQSSGVAESATSRTFTISGPEKSFGSRVVNAGGDISSDDIAHSDLARFSDGTGVSVEVLRKRLSGEEQFDAMLALVDRGHPGAILAGGAAPLHSGLTSRWVLTREEPGAELFAALATYGGELRVLWGATATPDEMSDYANRLRDELAPTELNVSSYGFSENYYDLEVRFTAAPKASTAELEGIATEAVAALGGSDVDVTFIEEIEPPLAEAAISGGYGLTRDGQARCTTGFTVVRNTYLGVVTAKHCTGQWNYRFEGNTLAAGATATDSATGEIDMRFLRTMAGHSTTKRFQNNVGTELTVEDVTPVVASDNGELRCHFGIKTGRDCSTLDDINYCGNIGWPTTPPTTHYMCGLVNTTTDVSDSGDSGGPWFTAIPDVAAVGTHTAAGSTFTNIGRVASNLNATVRQN